MKFTNQFRTIRGIFYLTVIASCFAFTSAKSAPLNFSSSNNIIGSNIITLSDKGVGVERNLEEN